MCIERYMGKEDHNVIRTQYNCFNFNVGKNTLSLYLFAFCKVYKKHTVSSTNYKVCKILVSSFDFYINCMYCTMYFHVI